MKKSDADRDVRIVAAALLYASEENATRASVGKQLKLSQATVSRLLKAAKRRRWLSEGQPTFHENKVESDLIRRAREQYLGASSDLEKRLAELPGSKLRELHVIHGPEDRFYEEAARVLEKLLAKAHVVGLTWGRTMREVVTAMEARVPELPPRRSQKSFFPVCGPPCFISRSSQESSSSLLAEKLSKAWNGPDADRPPSIGGVPAFIPVAGFTDEQQMTTISSFIAMDEGYREIFIGPKPLVEQADTILTSAGIADASGRGIFLKERVKMKDLTEKDMVGVLGDLGGLIITKAGASTDFKAQISKRNARWTGIKKNHLEKCAARSGPAPGVIAMAWNKNRARVLYRCVCESLISTLILSGQLADQLAVLVKKGEPSD